MAISAFVGLMGSGKSYSAIKQVVIPALEEGRPIVTNIPLTDEIYENPNFKPDITTFEITPEWDRESFFSSENLVRGAIYLIDEVHKLWPQGMRVSQFSQPEKEFITEHRHFVGEVNGQGLTIEIVLVTQNLNQIATYVRNLVDVVYMTTKLNKQGFSKKYRIDTYDRPITNPRPTIEPISTGFGKYDESVYKYYKSNTKNETRFDRGLEKPTSKTTIWHKPIVKYGMPLSVLIFALSIYYVSNFFSSGLGSNTKSNPQNVSVNQIEKSEPAKSGSNSSVDSAPYDFSTVWRISSIIKTHSEYTVIVTDNTRSFPIPFNGSCKKLPYVGVVCDFFGQTVSLSSGVIPKPEKEGGSFEFLGGSEK